MSLVATETKGTGYPAASAVADEDFCPILGFDHLELYVGNAKQSAAYYCHAFGFECTAVRGLETGERARASYLVEQGDIRLLLTSGLHSSHQAARSVRRHGDSVAVIALSVPDADAAFAAAVARGAEVAAAPATAADEHGRRRCSASASSSISTTMRSRPSTRRSCRR